MHNIQNVGLRTLVAPAALATNGTLTHNYIDTKEWDSAKIVVTTISGGNTTSVPDQIVIGHTDDTNSWGTLISYTTSSTGYPTGIQATSSTTPFAEFNIPQLTKRYLRVSITGAGSGETSCTVGATCILGRADVAPTGTNAGASVAYNVSV